MKSSSLNSAESQAGAGEDLSRAPVPFSSDAPPSLARRTTMIMHGPYPGYLRDPLPPLDSAAPNTFLPFAADLLNRHTRHTRHERRHTLGLWSTPRCDPRLSSLVRCCSSTRPLRGKERCSFRKTNRGQALRQHRRIKIGSCPDLHRILAKRDWAVPSYRLRCCGRAGVSPRRSLPE